MDFYVKSKGYPDNTTSIIIQEHDITVFHAQFPSEDDNINGLYLLLTYLQNKSSEELEALLKVIPKLLNVLVSEDAYPTYLNLLQATFKLLEQLVFDKSYSDKSSKEYDLYKELNNFLFHFSAEIQSRNYIASFSCGGKKIWEMRVPCEKFDKSPIQVSQAILNSSYQADQQKVCYFIENYTHFQSAIIGKPTTTIIFFTNLSEALVEMIKHNIAGLGIYISFVLDIATFLVENEPDLEKQKIYLELILNSQEGNEWKLERLDEIIDAIQESEYLPRAKQLQTTNHFELAQQGESKNKQLQEYSVNNNKLTRQEGDGDKRLMQLVSLISDHYLRLYDFDHSRAFWNKIKSKDPILKFSLALNRRPYIFLLFQLLPFSVLSFLAYQHWQPTMSFSLTSNLLNLLFGLPLVFYVLIFLIVVASSVQIIRKRGGYLRLLLPRILAASVVGLLPLLLNVQSWQIGLQINPINWLILLLLTYTGTFTYIYIEVYNASKSLKKKSKSNIFSICMKVFLIVFSETFFIVTVSSSIISPIVGLRGGQFGIYANLSGFALGFFPILILFWTGIALFIGSFVQLLWQDKRNTDSI